MLANCCPALHWLLSSVRRRNLAFRVQFNFAVSVRFDWFADAGAAVCTQAGLQHESESGVGCARPRVECQFVLFVVLGHRYDC
jgi:hypothetical protein